MKTPPLMSRLAVAYIRVSSKEQGEKFSLTAQRDVIEKFAATHNLEIVARFEDRETATGTRHRRGFAQMLGYLATHPECRTILCEKTDRMYRSPVGYAEVYTAVQRLGLTIFLVKESETPLSADALPHEFLMHEVNVAVASYQSRNMSREIKKGMKAKAESGAFPSAAFLGYRNCTNDRIGIEPDPTMAPLVRELFFRASEGATASELTRFARAIGLHSRRGHILSKNTVCTLLQNRAYAGEFTWGGATYAAAYEPLITPDLFDRVQEALRGRRNAWKGTRAFAFAPGLVVCGTCRGLLSGDTKQRPSGTYVYFHCNGSTCRTFYPERLFDEQVRAILASLRIDEAASAWLQTELAHWLTATSADAVQVAGRLRARVTILKTERLQAYRQKLAGEITEEFWSEVRTALDKEIAFATEELRRYDAASVPAAAFLAAATAPIELLQAAPALWVTQTPAEKAALLKSMVSNFEVLDGKLSPTYRKPFDILAKAAETKDWWS